MRSGIPLENLSQGYLLLNNRILLHFFQGKKLGEGAVGLVHLAEHQTSKEKVAMKKIDLEDCEEIMDLILLEIEVMRGINHPNLINFKQVNLFLMQPKIPLAGFYGRG